ncbi:hypothetical protein ACP4OV_002863 [Aristida adscensionis]
MEQSQKKHAATIVLLLMIVMATAMVQVDAGECTSKSKTYRGACFDSGECSDVCKKESPSNTSGRCNGFKFTCLCIAPCKPAAEPAAVE